MHKEVKTRIKLVTMEDVDICPTGWRIIHNISECTFQRYSAKAKSNKRGASHRNSSKTKTQAATVQAMETLRSLSEAKANHMSHLECILPTGKKTYVKVLPIGIKWKQFLATVNEVRIAISYLPHYRLLRNEF